VTQQNNFVGSWFLQDTSICDSLIDYYENQKDREVPGLAANQLREDFKKCKEIFFDYDEKLMIEYSNNHLQKICDEYTKKYNFCSQNPWRTREKIKIQKYLPGEAYYGWHCERDSKIVPMNDRHLVFMTYLNDVTDGGETEFYYQKLKVKPQKGLTLIWPADWTHTHRGVPSVTQTKYIITGWFHYV
jgi:hypothetical protein